MPNGVLECINLMLNMNCTRNAPKTKTDIDDMILNTDIKDTLQCNFICTNNVIKFSIYTKINVVVISTVSHFAEIQYISTIRLQILL